MNVTYKNESEYKVYLVCYLPLGVPISFDAAVELDDGWKKAIGKEINALEKHKMWEPATFPKREKAIDT